MKILIVDDAMDTRIYLGELFRKWGHQVVEANDGAEALTHLDDSELRLVISDWMMPELDGIDLCRAIRNTARDRYIYVILLTGKSAQEDLVQALNAGADDFLSKPFDVQVLMARFQVAERIVNLESRLSEQNQHLLTWRNELADAYGRIQSDLELAAQLQQHLLPATTEHAQPLNVAWLFNPAATVAGDIFNIFELGNEDLGFFHMDISGHGIPAAMLSVSMSNLLSPGRVLDRNGQQRSNFPATVVSELNDQLVDPDQECEHYATLVYGTLNKHTGSGWLCIAGHPPPVTVSASGHIKRMKAGGMPVGMFADNVYTDIPFELAPGERLVLYSDGITDYVDEANRPFGMERLLETLADSAAAPLEELPNRLDNRLNLWRGTAEIEDDVSLLVIERPAH
jgi:sigma-B regulation protein RsbU (phosphoserine phosphatase)